MESLQITLTAQQVEKVNEAIKAASDPSKLKSFDSTICPAYLKVRPILQILDNFLPGLWKTAVEGLEAVMDAECKATSM